MAGYTRQDINNNISNGNVIDADDLDNEFNGVEAAFNVGSGHKHDGSAGEGSAVTVIGPVQDIIASTTVLRPKTTNTVDLGTTTIRYKDAYLSGGLYAGGTVAVTGATTVGSTLDVTGNTSVGGNLTVTGNTTVSGNTTLGNAATDTVNFAADVASNILPSLDDTYDLGAVGSEWRNLYIDGTANIDTAVVDALTATTATISTADINGGNIDNTAIGVTGAAVGNFTGLSASGSATVGGTLSVTSTATLAVVDINSGNIDNTVIGAINPAAGTFTNVDVSGNITVAGSINATVVGVSSEATKLTTARTIALDGDVSGSANFDGSANITITATVADDSHNHVIANVDGLQTALDGKAAVSHVHTIANVDGLQTALDGKAAVSHTHIISNVTGLQTALDSKLEAVDLTSYTGDVDITGELVVQSYNETFVTLSTTTPDVNCESGNVFSLTTSGNTTFTFSNPPATSTAYGFTLKVTAGGTHTLTWPASVDWPGGTAPDAPASGETDVFVFYTVDGGTNWYGFQAGDAMA